MKKILLTSIAALAVTGVTSTVMAEEAAVKADSIWTSINGEDVLGNLISSLSAKKVDQSSIGTGAGALAGKTVDKTNAYYTTTSGGRTVSAEAATSVDKNYKVGDVNYSLVGVEGGTNLQYAADGSSATQDFVIASKKGKQYADVNASLKSDGSYAIAYGDVDDGFLTYKTGIVSGEDVDKYMLVYENDTTFKFYKQHNNETASELTISELKAGSEEAVAFDTLSTNYEANKATLSNNAVILNSQYDTMAEVVSNDNALASSLNTYQTSEANYIDTLSQVVDETYGAKLSQTLGYDVALKNITDADVLGKNVVTAIKDNTTAISDARDEAVAAYNHAHNWAEGLLGVDVDKTVEAQLQDALTSKEIIKANTIAGALSSLDAQVDANKKAIVTLNGDASVEGSVANTVKTTAKNADYDEEHTIAEAIEINTTAISAEETRAKAAEGVLTTAISNEAKARSDADTQLAQAMVALDDKLQSGIDANAAAISSLNQKVDTIEKDLSAGIASATALSSVAVANVKKGEMSVGGGYGNYNSKSAVAFGAAMGITDSWSVNAGAGMGFGNTTKASFRVGTNYKFKLF